MPDPTDHSSRFPWARPLKFLIPFAIWIFFFRKVFLGQSTVFGDGFGHYIYVNYLVRHLRMGIFPLWNPFLAFGSIHTFYSNFIGAFNPIWAVTLLCNLLGMTLYHAYLATITVYFFLGTLGFYLLVKTSLKDEGSAYAAFLLLLFSSFGMPIFLDLKYLVTFVPAVWFFYFCLCFYRTREAFAFVGMTLCVMISAACYFPPYWITIVVIAAALGITLFPRSMVSAAQGFLTFARQRKIVFFLCALALVVSLIPLLKTLSIVQNKEILFPWRSGDLNDALSHDGPRVTLERIQGLMLSLQYFADEYLDIGPGHLCYRDPAPFYVSIFAFILIFLGAFNQSSRSALAKFIFGLILLFIIAIPNGPVVKFFFNHLWGFNLIQGLRSFMPALIMTIIFLAVEHHRKILTEKFTVGRRVAWALIVLVHAATLAYLALRLSQSVFSYAAVVVSFCYFTCLVFQKDRKTVLFALFFVALLLQPMEALWRYGQNLYGGSRAHFEGIALPQIKPTFSYVRPTLSTSDPLDPCQEFWGYDLAMRDSPAAIRRDFPPRWTYALVVGFPLPIVEGYTRNKFYVYDAVMASDQERSELVTRALKKEVAVAVVHVMAPEGNAREKLQDLQGLLTAENAVRPGTPEAIDAPRQDFQVVAFNTNALRVQTNFDRDRFLVYADSYQPDWQVFVDGKRQQLYRTNIAFKGLRVPAGPHEIMMRYAPLGGEQTYFFALVVHYAMFLWLLVLACGRSRRKRGQETWMPDQGETT